MKPIEYCLDRILDELKISWEDAARPPLKAEQLLTEFEAPAGRHEFFKSIILKLVNDGYAYFMHDPIPTMNDPLDWFTTRTMLTAAGIYFIEGGGYRQQESDRKENGRRLRLENSRNQLNQILLVIGAIGAAVGAIGLILWEMYKYFCLEHH